MGSLTTRHHPQPPLRDQHVRRVKGSDEVARMESYFRRSVLTKSGLRKATFDLAQLVAAN